MFVIESLCASAYIFTVYKSFKTNMNARKEEKYKYYTYM